MRIEWISEQFADLQSEQTFMRDNVPTAHSVAGDVGGEKGMRMRAEGHRGREGGGWRTGPGHSEMRIAGP